MTLLRFMSDSLSAREKTCLDRLTLDTHAVCGLLIRRAETGTNDVHVEDVRGDGFGKQTCILLTLNAPAAWRLELRQPSGSVRLRRPNDPVYLQLTDHVYQGIQLANCAGRQKTEASVLDL